MTIYLRQSTASQEVPLGYFLDSTDGDTEETGLTIANTDIKIWKAGATTLANKNSGGGTHISNGVYYAVLDATDTNTLGSLVIFVHVSGALAVRLECVVLSANVYDSWIAGSDNLEVDTVAISGDATAADNAESFFDGTGYAGTNNTIPTVTNVTNQVTADMTAISGDSTAADNLEAAFDGTGYDLGGIDVSELNTAVDAIGSDGTGLTEAGGTGDHLTAQPWNAAWDAEVNAQVDTALSDIHLDHLLATDYDPSSKPGTGTALLNELVENDSGVSRFTANALEQAPSGGGGGGDATEAKQDTIIANLATAQSDLDILTGSDGATLATSQPNYAPNTTIPPTADAVADAVLDEALSGHTTAGTLGKAVADIEDDTDELQTNQGDWETATGFSTHSAADVVDEWETQSQADPTGFRVNVMEVNSTPQTANDNGADINDILTDVRTTIPALIAALNDLSISEVGDAVLDEVVEGSLTLRQLIRIVTAVLAGKSSGGGGSTISFRDNADSKNRVQATVDANGNRTAVTLDGS